MRSISVFLRSYGFWWRLNSSHWPIEREVEAFRAAMGCKTYWYPWWKRVAMRAGWL